MDLHLTDRSTQEHGQRQVHEQNQTRLNSRTKALLVLEDSSFFVGRAIGFPAGEPVAGELVFNTSMTGYQEALTDASYAGQVLVFTYPLIGNYGVSDNAFESLNVHPRAVIVSEACPAPFHYASKKSLHEFLFEQKIPGVEGVDTREITKKIRGKGVMPCALKVFDHEFELKKERQALLRFARKFDYAKTDFVKTVSCNQVQEHKVKGARKKIVVVDCGVKQSIVRELLKRKTSVVVVPAWTPAKKILGMKSDGVVVSNGPGDPQTAKYAIKTCKTLLRKLPIYGICLGHQILALALGAKTFKLKFGHRGSNHSVQDQENKKAFVTSQNHGYAVDAKTLPKNVREWFVNCLDGTNEGLKHTELPVMSTQFHPEANPGPYDANYLFNEFLKKCDRQCL